MSATTQRAVVTLGEGKITVSSDRAIPRLRPSYVKVAVKAVALNPTDWKSSDRSPAGKTVGCDYAGVVEEVGDDVEKEWKVGDKIAGFAHGCNELNDEDGAFAQHILVKGDVQLRVPDDMSFEDAATLGVGFLTCAQGLGQVLELGFPDLDTTGGSSTTTTGSKEPVLIYGGSTATGALGIQYAKLAGYDVITTCSPRNFEYVKSLGADAAFDYNDPNSTEEIKKHTAGKLKKVWDCVALKASAEFCSKVIASGGGGHYASLLPTKCPRDDVRSDVSLAYTAVGEPIDKGGFKKDDNSADFEFAKKWASMTEKLLARGKLKVHKPKISQGLEGVVKGLDLLKNDKVSGEKLVYVV